MKTISRLCLAALIAVSIASAPLAQAKEGKPYLAAKDLDLSSLLPPPPVSGSMKENEELAEVLRLQVTRSPDMVAQAQADATEDIWRFAGVVGPAFKSERLPKLTAFFIRVLASEGPLTDPAKELWKHPRPHQYSDLVKPVVKLSKSYSYPSGHATAGTLMAVVLANMLPEKRQEIMQRAAEYADNRLVAGIHFRSDIEAGRLAGTLIAATLMTRADFNADFEAARNELRAELGLPAMTALTALSQ
ncbi:acid phosphatase [Undibacterium terreum]|uniref:Acid phosphatase n=1 Tax=Undibacterium terreum TaxID=1224302 RepID=A0A916XEG1_9BURK|nr:phosphatase PAP2 family protein [Undibacterium terreum]GGC65897.1 acid phosphatase [Undibacterium terreum]